MVVEDIQAICKKMAFATEDIKWGHDLVFSIRGKMFCVIGMDSFPVTASFKVTEEDFEEMCIRDGFKPAPYVAKYKWVQIEDINKMNKKDWESYLSQSYSLVKNKLTPKIKKLMGIS
ncbi:MAG: MmcQ/YjbR family DNA-binding protein [Chitinophagaceae bacterium]|nr:MmcQ/YjbR family DNA-binding protein [Chitinophagaceae bacterium]